MVNKKKKAAMRAAAAANGEALPVFGATPTPTSTSPGESPPPPETQPASPSPEPTPAKPVDPKKEAIRCKEEGNRFFKEKKYQDSISWYTKAVENDPSNGTYLSNRSAAYIQLKQFRKALEDIQVSVGIEPENIKFLVRLARCQLALAFVGACASTLSSIDSLAIKLGLANQKPKDPAITQAEGYKSGLKTLQTNLSNFEKAKNQKNWSMARLSLDQCMKCVEAEPSEVPIEWRLEGIRLALHNTNASTGINNASTLANEVLRLHPQNPEVLTTRALVLFLNNKLPQSLQHLASALRLDPSLESASRLRRRIKTIDSTKEEGNVLFKSGKWEDALVKYDECLELVGMDDDEAKGGQIRGMLLSNKATTLLKMPDRTQDALDVISESLNLLPGNFKALRTRGRLYISVAQDPEVAQSECIEYYEKAVKDLRMAIEEGETELHLIQADIRALKNDLKKAEIELKRAKTKDYYKILSLKRDCSSGEIKKAYRIMSLKHHPDKGGDEEQFKLVSEAYSILSDPVKRQRYDDGEDDDDHGPGGMPAGMDLSELFAQFHGGGGFGGMGGGGFGGGGFGGGRRNGPGPGFSFHQF
ncbi:hypothetical protein DL96DRAFT_1525532 [Flagelloscypha sp. PMI_526]|nr:hypothetical protein DL96DRAFT_1525532 [Flagelloscypha sp. PMI_526]